MIAAIYARKSPAPRLLGVPVTALCSMNLRDSAGLRGSGWRRLRWRVLQGFDHDGLKGIGAEGLRDHGQSPDAGALHHGRLIQSRDENDRHRRSAAPNRLDQCPATRPGHDDINEEKVPAPRGEASQPADGIGGRLALIAERREEVLQDLPHVGIVVDEEYPGTRGSGHGLGEVSALGVGYLPEGRARERARRPSAAGEARGHKANHEDPQ